MAIAIIEVMVSTKKSSVCSFLSSITLNKSLRKMTLHPRNTQSDWMGEKEETLKEIFKNFGMEVVTKKYKVLQCFPQAEDPS